ncbi:hypothetical protein VPNG_05897 [Cytospora leucostoma]|uniref:Uncharacterized protein n=1 Tax=Cytospora leucostoma TaxID=1230097 RepID=A0A423X077_9PEZI|nr:hypothetical protein VPNG_05897 [Cytospora leucostoma]
MAHSTALPKARSSPSARKSSNVADSPSEPLAAQYGGNSSAGWLGRLPGPWLPYVQLARLSPPAGLCLVFFPHLFGLLHAGLLQQRPPILLFRTSIVLLIGNFFLSNAIHIWNDLIDAPLDAQVERTRNRPIPRGAVSPRAALLFTGTQALGAALFLPLCAGYDTPLKAALCSVPAILAWTYYPWAKRHTHVPQLVLGFCLAWGVFMGELAAGHSSFSFGSAAAEKRGRWLGVDGSALCLFAACVLWTMIYDTIYAQQDLEDDIKVGIKSLAVYSRGRTKLILTILLLHLIMLLSVCGWLSSMGPAFYLVTNGGAAMSLIFMIAKVDLESSSSCWVWFSRGFWLTGGAITAGLSTELVLQHSKLA